MGAGFWISDVSRVDELSKGARWGFVALIVALVLWEYAPSLSGGFVYEDYKLTDACTATGFDQRLLTRLSWCAQLAQGPAVMRATNLALHLVVVGLVGALAWTLTADRLAALLSAGAFAVNAVNIEAVAYLSSRGELIAAIGVLGACLAALYGRWYLIVPLAWIAWGGKEMAVVVVMLVPLCLWYARGGLWGWITALAGVWLGLELAARTVTWWWLAPSWPTWALLQATALARLTALAVLPIGQTVDYDYTRVPLGLQWGAVAALVAAIAWAWQQSRLIVFGAAWTLCAAAPRFIVPTPRSVFNEHQFYLPLVGLALVLAAFLTQESHGYRSVLALD